MEAEARYVKLKKRSVLLLLIALIGVIAYVALVLIINFALPDGSPRGLRYSLSGVGAFALVAAVISLVAAAVIRLVAALKKPA